MFKIQRRITPSLLARSSLSLYAGIRPPTLLTARRFQNTTEVDAHTGASVVLVDPKQAAQERDRLSRMLLTTNAAPRVGGILSNRLRQVVKLADVAHTVPYSLSFVVNSEHILDSGDLAEGQSEEEEEAVRMGKIEAYKAELTEKAKNVLKECFDMVNTHLNHFNPDSEISKLNALPVGQKHVMSAPLREVLMCVQEVYKASGNCFDASVLKLTKKLLKKANALTDADSASLIQVSKTESKRYSLPNCFEMDLENNTISRKFDDAELDLGGLNKGYTVDCVIQKLREAGIPNCLFEWGGDCKASGVNVQNSPWVVGIVRPPSVEELEKRYHDGQKDHRIVNLVTEVTPSGPSLLRVLTLNNEALCTSGDYENLTAVRTRNEAGEEVVSLYCSIYDWQDRTLLRPSDDHLAQVSVRCYSCMYADAFATASLVKKTPDRVRYMLEAYRSNYNRVTDYALYTRQGERLAHMHEIAKESRQLRDARIASALPARVIVIGGGLAGCAAAIEAAHCGAQVILLEKESKLGGNSAKATSGINGWGTRAQAENHVVDDCRFFERDTYLSGKGGHCDPGLVRTLSVKSSEAIEWLIQFGIPLTTLYQLGGHCRRRCHRVPDTADGKPVPVGYTIMSTLHRYIVNELKDKVTILYNTSVTDFIIDTKPLANGSKDVFVKGIHYKVIKSPAAAAEDAAKQRQRSPRQREEEEAKSIMSLTGDAVVLATGGFSNDRNPNSLLREYAPQLYGTPTTNGEFATGDGVKIASRYGASLVDMDKVQLHPTGLINPSDPSNRTKILGPEALRGSGGILLNQDGERFINELDLRSVVSQAILAQEHEYPNSGGSKFAYCVLGEEAAKLFGVNALHYYWKELGVFTRVETLQELADLMHCPIANLEHTLTEYQELSSAKKVCPSTGKVVYPSVLGPKGPFYVAYVTPSIHYTMGGCLISPSAEILMDHTHMVLFEDKKPIYGLFGAGEVTGGVHGGNRLGGNSLLECVVFGRIAGDRAATILQRDKNGLRPEDWSPVVVSEVRAGDKFGIGSRVLRFNLPGAVQKSGLAVGQFIGIRGNWDGQQLIGYYSPITLPDDKGRITILARGDKGNLQEWIRSLRPGDAVEMKACGGLQVDRDPAKKQLLYKKTPIRKLGLVAGGSGVAPMLQIIRAALSRPYVDHIESIRLIYAAEDEGELTYREQLQRYMEENPDKLSVAFVLNSPPEGWVGGVGYVVQGTLQKYLQPPEKDMLIAICGPPVMQDGVVRALHRLGYNEKLVHTVDEETLL